MRRMALVVVAAWTMTAWPRPVAAEEVKLGTLAPDGSAWYNIVRDMAESWKTASGGRVVFKIWPGGVQGDEPAMVRKMRVDQLQAAALSGEGLSEIAPEVEALQMPMMLRSYDELDYVMERIAPKLERILDAKGFKVLNWGDAGWVYLFAQKPVTSPDDLKPLKLFVWGGKDAYIEAYKDAGCHPVPLASTDILLGLKSGLINAFATTPYAALSFQWFGAAKNMTDLKWAPLVAATIITTRKWQKIPDDVKPALLQAARDAGVRLRASRKLADEAVEKMKQHGLVVHAVSPEQVARWEREFRAAYPKLVGAVVPADMVAEVEKLRDEYRVSRTGP